MKKLLMVYKQPLISQQTMDRMGAVLRTMYIDMLFLSVPDFADEDIRIWDLESAEKIPAEIIERVKKELGYDVGK